MVARFDYTGLRSVQERYIGHFKEYIAQPLQQRNAIIL
tara:strand:- start:3 stop:116 length:114 start_codon:yes stop_codon:yes gene_type:complete